MASALYSILEKISYQQKQIAKFLENSIKHGNSDTSNSEKPLRTFSLAKLEHISSNRDIGFAQWYKFDSIAQISTMFCKFDLELVNDMKPYCNTRDLAQHMGTILKMSNLNSLSIELNTQFFAVVQENGVHKFVMPKDCKGESTLVLVNVMGMPTVYLLKSKVIDTNNDDETNTGKEDENDDGEDNEDCRDDFEEDDLNPTNQTNNSAFVKLLDNCQTNLNMSPVQQVSTVLALNNNLLLQQVTVHDIGVWTCLVVQDSLTKNAHPVVVKISKRAPCKIFNLLAPILQSNSNLCKIQYIETISADYFPPEFMSSSQIISISVMELLVPLKSTLISLLQSNSHQKVLLTVFSEMISCIKVLHSNNIIHGDISMNNFMIRFKNNKNLNNYSLEDIEIVLIDFDESICISNSSDCSLSGTPYYAPFMFDKVSTCASDIFSLGMVLLRTYLLSVTGNKYIIANPREVTIDNKNEYTDYLKCVKWLKGKKQVKDVTMHLFMRKLLEKMINPNPSKRLNIETVALEFNEGLNVFNNTK